jgi:hypothetical protein
MSKILFFKRLKENVGMSMVNLACVLMIVLLTGACVTGSNKQTTSHANETGQVSAKDESKNVVTDDSQEIECRRRAVTGSRLKKKICRTKAEWAAIDNKRRKKSDEFLRDMSQESGVNTGEGTDPMGGMSSGMPR